VHVLFTLYQFFFGCQSLSRASMVLLSPRDSARPLRSYSLYFAQLELIHFCIITYSSWYFFHAFYLGYVVWLGWRFAFAMAGCITQLG